MSSATLERVREMIDGNIGISFAFLNAKSIRSDKDLETLLDKAPGKGADLWENFKKFKQDEIDRGGDPGNITFDHFITSIIKPVKLQQAQ